MLAVHNAITAYLRKAQQQLGKLDNSARHAVHADALDTLPETASPNEQDNPLRREETRTLV